MSVSCCVRVEVHGLALAILERGLELGLSSLLAIERRLLVELQTKK